MWGRTDFNLHFFFFLSNSSRPDLYREEIQNIWQLKIWNCWSSHTNGDLLTEVSYEKKASFILLLCEIQH